MDDHHVERNCTEFRDAAIEALLQIIADDEQGAFRHPFGLEGRLARYRFFRPIGITTRTGRMKRLTIDKDGAVGAGSDEIAGKPDHAFDQKVIKRWMLEENDVSALGYPRWGALS